MSRRHVLTTTIALACTLVACKQKQTNEFTNARALVVEGNYKEAIARLEHFAKPKPGSPQASRAGLFLFKAYVGKNQYGDAARWCNWTIENYVESLEAHKCEYKLALLDLWQGRSQTARDKFEAMSKSIGPLRVEAAAMARFLSGAIDPGEPIEALPQYHLKLEDQNGTQP